MDKQLLLELKVINRQLSQIRRDSPMLPTLSDIYDKTRKELELDED